MMTRTLASSRLRMLAKVCTEEAQQWPRHHSARSNLTRAALQLATLARKVAHPSSDVDEAVIETYLVESSVLVARLAAARAFKEKPWS